MPLSTHFVHNFLLRLYFFLILLWAEGLLPYHTKAVVVPRTTRQDICYIVTREAHEKSHIEYSKTNAGNGEDATREQKSFTHRVSHTLIYHYITITVTTIA